MPSARNQQLATILHAAHTETLQRGEILTRSVSEEIGCEASLTLRVSVRNDRVEYSRAGPFFDASGVGRLLHAKRAGRSARSRRSRSMSSGTGQRFRARSQTDARKQPSTTVHSVAVTVTCGVRGKTPNTLPICQMFHDPLIKAWLTTPGHTEPVARKS